ncbi:hypothetical protein HZB01_05005 [Candidatus Woesearchaeota archaeon]|nr:hypothetical protein [Candidatus Woesearchaeota archaeon]
MKTSWWGWGDRLRAPYDFRSFEVLSKLFSKPAAETAVPSPLEVVAAKAPAGGSIPTEYISMPPPLLDSFGSFIPPVVSYPTQAFVTTTPAPDPLIPAAILYLTTLLTRAEKPIHFQFIRDIAEAALEGKVVHLMGDPKLKELAVVLQDIYHADVQYIAKGSGAALNSPEVLVTYEPSAFGNLVKPISRKITEKTYNPRVWLNIGIPVLPDKYIRDSLTKERRYGEFAAKDGMLPAFFVYNTAPLQLPGETGAHYRSRQHNDSMKVNP